MAYCSTSLVFEAGSDFVNAVAQRSIEALFRSTKWIQVDSLSSETKLEHVL